MTYRINQDGTVQVLSCPNTGMCQGRIMSNTDSGFIAISKARLGQLFGDDD